MLADLHLHSSYSDGKYTPDEVCRRAAWNGVSLLSITDHDTLSGEEEKRAAAKKYGLRYVTGWEISAYEQEEKLHILGYGCRLNEAYFRFVEERKSASLLRAQDSVNKLRALGIPVETGKVLARRLSDDLPVHTMHVAREAAEHLGISEGEVYLRYLAVGKPAHSSVGRPTPKEAIDCIHALGGIASVAHPGRLTFLGKARERALFKLIDEGVDGIEGVYTTHTKEETAYFIALARENGLYLTGGSDTHFEEETHKIGSPAFTPDERLLSRLL